MRRRRLFKQSGFTIVELLIVIVVIGILAALVIVAYNGMQDRANYAKMRTDMSALNKAIQAYYAENGSYPVTPNTGTGCSGNWCGFDQTLNDNFIPNITPRYLADTPQLPTANTTNDTYLYRSPLGTDYKLIRYKSGGLSNGEKSTFSDLRTTDCSATYNDDRWGYWSSSVSKCW